MYDSEQVMESKFPDVFLKGCLVDNTFADVNISEILNKWKVVYFYPKDFTFVCPTEIVDFDNHVEEFAKLNALVFGVSPDNEHCKLAWKDSHPDLRNLKHALLADSGNELAFALGIVSSVEKVPYRATYILDERSRIKHVSINGLNVGRNAAEVLRILDSTQKGEDGMLCAANRKVGGAGIDV